MNRIIIEAEYKIGDTVFLKTDPSQMERMVYAIEMRGVKSNILYGLVCGDETSDHWEFEITRDKDDLKATISE
jgi:hypothetical protein